jgi:hypothetical protein
VAVKPRAVLKKPQQFLFEVGEVLTEVDPIRRTRGRRT